MPTLEITTKLGCSLACSFCPQDEFIKNYPRNQEKILSLENFKLALESVPKHVRIDFSGMTEPWLNLDATEMVNYAYECEYPVAVYTTLEGMSAKDAKLLLERFHRKITPYTPWVIHLPDSENNMRGWRISDKYIDTLNAILDYKKKFNIESLTFMTMSADGIVAPDLAEIFKLKLEPFVGISRAENLDREKFKVDQLTKKTSFINPVICKSTPFYDHNGLLPNGDVVLCCMDYGLQNIVGNLLTGTYQDIFRSKRMSEVRLRSMAVGIDSDHICKNCENAACLSQGGDGEWTLDSKVYWG